MNCKYCDGVTKAIPIRGYSGVLGYFHVCWDCGKTTL